MVSERKKFVSAFHNNANMSSRKPKKNQVDVNFLDLVEKFVREEKKQNVCPKERFQAFSFQTAQIDSRQCPSVAEQRCQGHVVEKTEWVVRQFTSKHP